jgi:uncharacterized membrane protein YphA (DoxX/SURF4 family)
MSTLQQQFTSFDQRLTRWLARYGIILLRISIGIVYFWFGVLKFFPNLSPAQDLAARTIETLTFGIVPPATALFVLAVWECAIGIGLITGKFMRVTLLLLVVQMLGTVTPLFLFPQETWTQFPFAPTLEGQYIIKNIIIVSAALVLGATVRGGAVVDDPKVASEYRAKVEAGAGD